jgi:hypothetical protein
MTGRLEMSSPPFIFSAIFGGKEALALAKITKNRTDVFN